MNEIIKYETPRKLLISSLDKIIFEYLSLLIKKKRGWFIRYIKTMPWLLEWINEKTPRLNDKKFNLETKLRWIFDDRDDFPICPTCQKYYATDVVFQKFSDYYQHHCSYRCSTLDKDVKKKYEKTCMKLYHVKNGGGSVEAVQKIKRTKFERYGDENYCNVEKIKSIRQTKETNPEFWERWKIAFKKTMGTKETKPEFWAKMMEKVRTTSMIRHGGIGYGSPSLKDKILNSEREHHGGVLHVQTVEFAKNRRKRILYNNVYYDSSWEIKVVEFCNAHKIEYQYQPNTRFAYMYNGKQYYYQPDFLINGNFYEIKGDHFFRINEVTGEEEMFCPFRYKNSTDEEYENILE